MPTATPRLIAPIISGVSSKRRKCTDDVLTSSSRSRSSSATAHTLPQPCTSTQALDSTPLSRISAARRSSMSGYSIIKVAFQFVPSGISGL